ncbi:hypothetical protein ACH5RR_039859 [Cinchona calisaya]|uniref:Peptidase M41 domain-containing protein n=1 Tax=Cinchona calisaya TaxID=153742 RepID=A0ABD2XZI6_9GENT
MVTKYSMSINVGLVTHNYDDNSKSMSTETRLLIEEEVKHLLEKAYNNAKTILTTHSKELHALANALLEHEMLSGFRPSHYLTGKLSAKATVATTNGCHTEHIIVQCCSPSTLNAAASAAIVAAAAATTVAKAKGLPLLDLRRTKEICWSLPVPRP